MSRLPAVLGEQQGAGQYRLEGVPGGSHKDVAGISDHRASYEFFRLDTEVQLRSGALGLNIKTIGDHRFVLASMEQVQRLRENLPSWSGEP